MPDITPQDHLIINDLFKTMGNTSHEGDTTWPYLDTHNNITFGKGHNIGRSFEEFSKFPWHVRNRRATSDEVKEGFSNLIQEKSSNRLASAYKAMTPLRLSGAQVDQILRQDIETKYLSAKNYIGIKFDQLTAGQKKVAVDLHFNAGLDKFSDFVKAAREGSTIGMAREASEIFTDKPNGKFQRNWDRIIQNHMNITGKTRKDTIKDLAGIFKGREKQEANIPEELKKTIKELYRNVTQLLCQGIVAVSAYVRGTGAEVDSYDRACPGTKNA